jgi:hypothetical protein
MKSFFRYFFIFFILILLAGCITPNVPIQNSFWQNKSKIAVAMTKIPKPQLYKVGQQGLLDMAISDSVTKQFDEHIQLYNLSSLVSLKPEFINNLQKNGVEAVSFDEPIRVDRLNYFNNDKNLYATRNYQPYLGHVGADKLLLFSINRIGSERYYYGFIPTSSPTAICFAEGRLIDLKTNRVLWRQQANITIHVSGKWHQPPNYPNFDKALMTAIDTAKVQLIDSFFNKTAH